MHYHTFHFSGTHKFVLWFANILFFLSCAQNTERQSLIHGKVTADGNGIGNVVVTDGYQCVVTDSDGSFSLAASPDAGFVYISTPAGFLPEEKMNLPQFYHKIEREKEKRYDFQLTKNPHADDKHILLVHADPQFHKEENFQMYEEVIDDIQQLKTTYPDSDIFGIDCGDLVGDKPELYPLYIEHLNRTGIPFYRLPGNHDLEFGGGTTETSTQRYEETFGPDHYSFNRGLIHYIVLNNVFYLGRDYFYMGYIDEKTFQWLEEDLSYVPKGATIFVAMHIPAQLNEEKQSFSYTAETISAQTVNISALFDKLDAYNVHILTGHMHYNKNIIHSDNLYEHNTGAISGAWWQGDYCLDGTPIGYGVYEMDRSHVEWYFKSVGHDRDYQMRVYPPSTTHVFGRDVVANIWNWDKNWRVEWYENGENRGEMTRFEGYDPEVERAYSDKEKLEFRWIAPIQTDHLFRATPQQSSSEIKITAKDPFGKVYTETIQR